MALQLLDGLGRFFFLGLDAGVGGGIRLFPELPDPFFCFLVQFPVKLSGPFLILRGQLFFLFCSLEQIL